MLRRVLCSAGGLWRARQEIGQLLRSYDPSCADEALLKVLVSAGCADVASILAANDNASQVSSSHTHKASAGKLAPRGAVLVRPSF